MGHKEGSPERKVSSNIAIYSNIGLTKKEKVERQGKELGDLVKRTIHDNFKCFSSSNIRNFIFTCVMVVIVLYLY